MSNPATAVSATSLDEVFKAVQHWRDHKTDYKGVGIPDDIWVKIFQLESQGYTGIQLRRLFGLNSAQYSRKYMTLTQEDNSASTIDATPKSVKTKPATPPPCEFGEATLSSAQQAVPSLDTVAANQTRQALSQLKSTHRQAESYLDINTVIVECIRPDGHRLKIHTTSERLDILMQSFFAKDSALL